MKKDSLVFIKHILDSINDVEEYTKNISNKEKFFQKKVVCDAVIRKIEIMGEAVKNIPLSFRNKYPKIPWKGVAGMRDKLSHLYFDIDLNRVWNVVKEDIPKLKKQIKEILKAEE
jgi:uncharacterized protein with HEPN domain